MKKNEQCEYERECEYGRVVKWLESVKCPECSGTGKCDDADLSGIMFNRWECLACKGSGFNMDTDSDTQRRVSLFFKYTLFAIEKSQ